MSASVKKLFREAHRDARLRPIFLGQREAEEVRPLSLTPSLEKIITIKDSVAQSLHEEPVVAPAPSLS